MPPWSRPHLVLITAVVVLGVAGAILIWLFGDRDLGRLLIGATVLVGVMLPAVLRSRERQH